MTSQSAISLGGSANSIQDRMRLTAYTPAHGSRAFPDHISGTPWAEAMTNEHFSPISDADGSDRAEDLFAQGEREDSPGAIRPAISGALRVITVDDEPLALRRLHRMLEEVPHVEHVGSASGCASALELIAREKPDLILLDVCMRDGTGFDLLDRLPDKLVPTVIFVTGFDIYATNAFDVRAVDYLLKPFDLARLRLALERARNTLDAKHSVERIRELREVVISLREGLQARMPARFEQEFWIRRQGGGYVRIAAHDIDFVVADDDYVKIRTGGREHLMRETVKGMHARLDPQQFIRIHRSAVVRIAAVKEFRRNLAGGLEASMRDGSFLPVGRVYAKSLRKVIAAS